MFSDSQLPADGAAAIPYKDNRELVNGVLRHGAEKFYGSVVGAGGIGGTLVNVPFEPAAIKAINAAGATPAVHESIFATGGAVHTTTAAAVAANATPPTLAQVGTNDWTITFPVGMLPNGETLTVEVTGARDIAGGE